MHIKDYWNFITHNAKRVTSSCTFCCCCAGALFSDIGVIFKLFNDGFWNTEIYAMFGCKFTPGVEKCYHSFANDAILTNKWLKTCRRSDGVNYNTSNISSFYFSYPLKYVFFNYSYRLMWNINKKSVNTNFTEIWLIRMNKNMYDQC